MVWREMLAAVILLPCFCFLSYLPLAGMLASIDWAIGEPIYGIWNVRVAAGCVLAWMVILSFGGRIIN